MTSERAADGWEELRREIEALVSPLTRAISANPAETYERGYVSAVSAVLAIVDRLAATRGEPPEPDYEEMRKERGWPTPNHMRRTADALDSLTPARYGDVLRWVADLCDAAPSVRAALVRTSETP